MKNHKIDHYQGIENELSARLHPYQPRRDYVNQLHEQLAAIPVVEMDNTNWKPHTLYLSMGVIGFLVGFISLICYIWSFFQDD